MSDPSVFEVRIRGLQGDSDQRLKSLATLLKDFQAQISEPRLEEGVAIVPFKSRGHAMEFTQKNHKRPFGPGTFLQVEFAGAARPQPEGSEHPAASSAGHSPVAFPGPVSTGPITAASITEPAVPQDAKINVLPELTFPAPYHFVPVAMPHALAAEPVWHDRVYPEKCSGELRLDITALTPLLAGNYQYPIAVTLKPDLASEQRDTVKGVSQTFNQDLKFPAQMLWMAEDGTFACYTKLQEKDCAQLRDYLSNKIEGVDWVDFISRLRTASQAVNEDLIEKYRALYLSRRQALSDHIRLNPDKQIVEPMALPREMSGQTIGPILVSGTTLDGMLRHSIAALLSAPMERVRERTFSYRPNVKLDPPNDDYLRSLVGVVESIDSGSLAVRILPSSLSSVAYIENPTVLRAVCKFIGSKGITIKNAQDYAEALAQSMSPHEFAKALAELRIERPISDVKLMTHRYKDGHKIEVPNKLQQNDHYSETRMTGAYLLSYRPGLDGKGIFKHAYNGGRGYEWVIVRWANNLETVAITPETIRQWNETLLHLSDSKEGHLADHPKIGNCRDRAIGALHDLIKQGWRPGDLVYFELSIATRSVVTMGHHFRYRWRYRDTILQTINPQNGNRQFRAMLSPAELELPQGSCTRPQRLTPARRLFGYATATGHDEEDGASATLHTGIGLNRENKATDFSQLAGRITFNTAIEQVAEDVQDKDRFLNASHDFLVPLRPLGSPKPSAVEHYLAQDPCRLALREDAGILNTYGDTDYDPSAGELAGRKFYLHQPEAAKIAHCYELCQVDPEPEYWTKSGIFDGPERSNEWRMAEDEGMFFSNQAAIGRFVSRPGRKFGVTLRFSNLDWWELGAVLLSLIPTPANVQSFAEKLGAAGEKTREYLKKLPRETPSFANKLGHGRPLGLGSIQFDLAARLPKGCAARRVEEATCAEKSLLPGPALVELTKEDQEKALLHLATFLEESGDVKKWVRQVFLPWLRAQQYAGRRRFDYPRNRRGDVFGYHTKLRADHIGGRKNKRNPRWEARKRGLRSISKII
jgi:CRISPR-associated protein (TIGR03986 family)